MFFSGATDADTSDNNITFTLSPGGGQGQMGFMSFKSRPNVPIHSFTQEDLVRSKILFTHTGTKSKLGVIQKAVTSFNYDLLFEFMLFKYNNRGMLESVYGVSHKWRHTYFLWYRDFVSHFHLTRTSHRHRVWRHLWTTF